MQLFERIGVDDHEEVVYCHDRKSGLRAIIAIHSTRLGPALGGTRFYPYESEDAALEDVLRLAKGMTYKAAAAGLDLGGGKAVVIGDPRTAKSEALLRAYGRFVETLGRRYITAEDVGTTQADMDVIRRETAHVTGVSRWLGGSGDPSAATAYGVFHAMKATALASTGSNELAERHVVVAGVGKVGTNLVRHLVEERCHVSVADLDEDAVGRVQRDFGVDAVPPEKAHALQCDIYSPCALGGALNADTIPELRCWAIVGSANNQLADASNVELLARTNVLYAPDFIVNAGGLINVSEELAGYHRERAYARIRRIYDTTLTLIEGARAEGISTTAYAERMAEQRIDDIGRLVHITTF